MTNVDNEIKSRDYNIPRVYQIDTLESCKKTDAELRYRIELNNKRGHAGEFATANTPGVTESVEQAVVSIFADTMSYLCDVSLENIKSNPQDPPDCFAMIEGRRVHIELTELVDGNALAAAKKIGGISHNITFEEMQWSSGRFFSEVCTLIDKKDKKYRVSEKAFDCLLIYSGELWLYPKDVQFWLRETSIAVRESFRSVYFLMTYDPGYSTKHNPVFRLYGDLWGNFI